MKTPSVSLLLDHQVVLKIPEDPVMTGSEVTLYCKKTKGDYVDAYFYFNKTLLGSEPQPTYIIHKVQKSDEGFYSCASDLLGESPESRLRVRDPPTSSDPHTTASSTSSPLPPASSTNPLSPLFIFQQL